MNKCHTEALQAVRLYVQVEIDTDEEAENLISPNGSEETSTGGRIWNWLTVKAPMYGLPYMCPMSSQFILICYPYNCALSDDESGI